MISAKENMRRLYSHEMPEFLPEFGVGMHLVIPQNGYLERPPYGEGGKDWFGVQWIKKEGDLGPCPSNGPDFIMEDICDWREAVKFPDLDNWDWEKAKELDNVYKIDRTNNLVYCSVLNGLFERLHTLMGFENALCALLSDEEEVAAFFDALVEFKCKLIDKLAEHYKPDIINYHDDWGTQRAMFFSPDLWRRLIKPRTQKIIEFTHSKGMFFELHSCGLIQDIIPEICEIGVDCLQCMDINDIVAAKKITGTKMAYNVSPNEQRYAALSDVGELTEEQLRSEIREEVMAFAQGGCYFPFAGPPVDWVSSIIYDEIARCREVLYK
jgi:hypothetical protein